MKSLTHLICFDRFDNLNNWFWYLYIIDLLRPQTVKFLSSTMDMPHQKYKQKDQKNLIKVSQE